MRYRFPIAVIFFALVLAIIAALSLPWLSNPDIYWLIQDGKHIWEKGDLPRQDSYSYTVTGELYVHNEFLSKFWYALCYNWLSFPGLALWAAIAVILFGFILTLSFPNPWFWRITVLLLAYHVSFSRFILTGELFSLIFFILIWQLLLLFEERKKTSYLWAIVLVQTLWLNCHSGYLMGLMIIGGYLIGRGSGHLIGKQPFSPKELRHLTTMAAGVALAILFANPFGPRYLFTNLTQHLTGEYPLAMRTIAHYGQELLWIFPITHHLFTCVVLALLLAVLYIRSPKKLSLGVWLVVAIYLYLSFQYPLRALQYLGVLLAGSILALALDSPRISSLRLLPISMLLFAVIATGVVIKKSWPKEWQVEKTQTSLTPMKKFWKDQLPPREWLTDFALGSQMILKFPQRPTFFDGRIFPFINKPALVPQQIPVHPYFDHGELPFSIYNLGLTLVRSIKEGNVTSPLMQWAKKKYQIQTLLFPSHTLSPSPQRARIFLIEENEWILSYADDAVLMWLSCEALSDERKNYLIEHLEQIPASPNHNTILLLRSIVARNLGERKLAEKLLQQMDGPVPHYFMFQYYRHVCRLLKGNTVAIEQHAEVLAEQLQKLKASLSADLVMEGYIALIDCWLQAHQPGRAVFLARQAELQKIAYQPPDLFLYLARCYRQLRQPQLARQCLEAGLLRYPTHASLLRQRRAVENWKPH